MPPTEGRNRSILDRLDADLSNAYGSVYVLEAGLETLLQIAQADAGAALVLASERSSGILDAWQGMAEESANELLAFLHAQLERSSALSETPELSSLLQKQGYSSHLLLPFVVSGFVIGGAVILNPSSAGLTSRQQRQLDRAVEKIAAALERIRLLEELQARVLEWGLLMRIGQEIVSIPGADLLGKAVSLVASTFGYEQVVFLRRDSDGWQVDAAAGKSLDGWKVGDRIADPGGLLASADGLASGEAAWSNDLSRDGSPATSNGVRAEVAVPVRLGSETLGVLDVRASAAGVFTQRDPGVLGSVADQMAVALENQRLLQQAQKRAAYLESVARIGQRLVSILRMKDLLHEVVDSVGRLLGYEAVYVFLLDEGGSAATLVADCHLGVTRYHEERVVQIAVHDGGLISKVCSTGELVLVNDVRTDPDFVPTPGFPALSEICIPLRAGDRMIGILDIESERLNAFTGEDAHILALLANLIAVAIENARLYERERETASELAGRNLELVQAQARLVSAERLAAIGQISLAIKHEINNPMTAILGNAEWLLEEEEDLSGEGRQALKLVYDMALRVRDIVARLETVEDVRRPYLGQEMIDLTRAESAK